MNPLVVVSCQLLQGSHIHTGSYLYIIQLFQTQTPLPLPSYKIILQYVQGASTVATGQNYHPMIPASITKSGVTLLQRGQQLHTRGLVKVYYHCNPHYVWLRCPYFDSSLVDVHCNCKWCARQPVSPTHDTPQSTDWTVHVHVVAFGCSCFPFHYRLSLLIPLFRLIIICPFWVISVATLSSVSFTQSGCIINYHH